jgi:Cys-tRNA(Pro)/Cys-tRNA(Cys) deacylase
MKKTQAMRALDARGISYVAKEYDASREFHSAAEAAELLGAAPDAVFKTLVVLRDVSPAARPLLVVVPSTRQLDLRLLAREIGEKKLRMATQREAEKLTGLQVGGISALALLNRPFDVLLDASAARLGRIHVSAGVRGVDVEVSTSDFVATTGAHIVGAIDETPPDD